MTMPMQRPIRVVIAKPGLGDDDHVGVGYASISRPTVPAPATTISSSKGWTSVRPVVSSISSQPLERRRGPVGLKVDRAP